MAKRGRPRKKSVTSWASKPKEPKVEPMEEPKEESVMVAEEPEAAVVEPEAVAAELPDDANIDVEFQWEDRPKPLDIELKDPNLVPYWLNTKRLDHGRRQGWTPTTWDMIKHRGPVPSNAPKAQSSHVIYQDLMLHHMTKERHAARKRYYAEKTRAQTEGLKKSLSSEIGPDGDVYGKIEDRKGR